MKMFRGELLFPFRDCSQGKPAQDLIQRLLRLLQAADDDRGAWNDPAMIPGTLRSKSNAVRTFPKSAAER